MQHSSDRELDDKQSDIFAPARCSTSGEEGLFGDVDDEHEDSGRDMQMTERQTEEQQQQQQQQQDRLPSQGRIGEPIGLSRVTLSNETFEGGPCPDE